MTFQEKISLLELNNLPLPSQKCPRCSKTIYVQDNWLQCPNCGTLSTAFGGYFSTEGVSDDWKLLCQQSEIILSTI